MQSPADNMSVDGGFDTLDYRHADASGAHGHAPVCGEKDLWCAVIAQAFVDMGAIAPATSRRQPGAPMRGKECAEAMRWLLRDKADFAYVCDLAGVEPHIIRRAAQMFYGKSRLHLGALHNIHF